MGVKARSLLQISPSDPNRTSSTPQQAFSSPELLEVAMSSSFSVTRIRAMKFPSCWQALTALGPQSPPHASNSAWPQQALLSFPSYLGVEVWLLSGNLTLRSYCLAMTWLQLHSGRLPYRYPQRQATSRITGSLGLMTQYSSVVLTWFETQPFLALKN